MDLSFTDDLWWGQTSQYEIDTVIPTSLKETAGPNSIGLVEVFKNATAPGWALNGGFMKNYMNSSFSYLRGRALFMKRKKDVAILMRSTSTICVDIDGKNGGFEGVKQLGFLPPTLAEISHSHNGVHLFYETDDVWDDVSGFSLYNDKIGVAPGVDIRAVGCVYHRQNQLWNKRPLAKIPVHLHEMLLHSSQMKQTQSAQIARTVAEGDKMDQMILHQQLKDDLAKDIPVGRRNNTLYAIGQQMKEAGVEGWEMLIRDRALQVHIDVEEAERLVRNINTYGA